MQQELPSPGRLVIDVTAMGVRADVNVVDPDFVIFDAREAVPKVHASFTDRFYLGSLQHDACLERLENVIIVQRLPILGRDALGFLAF